MYMREIASLCLRESVCEREIQGVCLSECGVQVNTALKQKRLDMIASEYVCECVCVRERERLRERVCVGESVCVRERSGCVFERVWCAGEHRLEAETARHDTNHGKTAALRGKANRPFQAL